LCLIRRCILRDGCMYCTSADCSTSSDASINSVLNKPQEIPTFFPSSYILIEIMVMVPSLPILVPLSCLQPQMPSCTSQPSQIASYNIGKGPVAWWCLFLLCS
jgi:hypothetical protein